MPRTPVVLLLAAVVAALVSLPPGSASATSKSRPTVAGELQKLVAARTLDPALATRYRDADRQARTTLKRLHGFRHAQLKAVIANLDAA
ncbi:MAG: hypothetical protein QOH30_4059, partial [Baekduia sp.]|nr:hypothetical protein [Baekduia sp.]